MLLSFHPPFQASAISFSQFPDPWDSASEKAVSLPTWPRVMPLDPSHELSGMPIPDAIMPAGLPGALQLTAPFHPVQSAIAILLTDELKLASQADNHLRQDIRDAIAVLEMSYAEGGESL
jgi:hypothetical protein